MLGAGAKGDGCWAVGMANGEGSLVAGAPPVWNTSLADMRTVYPRRPWAITERKVGSVPSMIVPRSRLTCPEAS